MKSSRPRHIYQCDKSREVKAPDDYELVSIPPRIDDEKDNVLIHDSATSSKQPPSEFDDHVHLCSTKEDQRTLSQCSKTAICFSGWRAGAFSAACIALLSLLINIVAAVWLQGHPDNSSKQLVTVFRGDCDTVARMDIWVHLLINVLSTLLLGGSNYCMQCLSAPTRSEVDKAHASGNFLDIVVPSYRNLRHIAWFRVLLWWMLALSSLPLHLLLVSPELI